MSRVDYIRDPEVRNEVKLLWRKMRTVEGNTVLTARNRTLLDTAPVTGVPSGGAAGAIRRDIALNRGAASDHKSEQFLENRQATNKGDVLWLSIQLGSALWDWLRVSGRD